MTIAQASCTLSFCYGMANIKSIVILFFTCRLGYVTLTAYELLKIGNRIQKNRSSVTRATLFWALSPVVVLYVIADVAGIIVSGISSTGIPPFWLYVVSSCLGLVLAGGCNLFAWAPIVKHSYTDPVTKPVASAVIWYFVTLHLIVPGLIGQYIAVFALGNVWYHVTWIVVEGCLRIFCQIIFGVIPPRFILDPMVDFMKPKLQLQVTTDDRPNGSSANSRSTNPHFLGHSPLSTPGVYNSTIALADVDYDKASSIYQPSREAQATY
ncbi:hypothetical protein K450DRAFT_296486 [Umbelopsis ramanniana AG]|uniref:Transmembrane protein n=1 Tax=Umbelopsis ramanniana AG TaxID=1314678 RepID=A0AAD5EJX4_UMBRA|nr:uncharacterized protein K450DRAFT_296486 [Umbelopsis ramanniana AG]KAI8584351.1 hypothetical protein K450DRAFT_296486 [Umbelopsis ramanniana AG]